MAVDLVTLGRCTELSVLAWLERSMSVIRIASRLDAVTLKRCSWPSCSYGLLFRLMAKS